VSVTSVYDEPVTITSNTETRTHYAFLDALRGVASLLVVIYHTNKPTGETAAFQRSSRVIEWIVNHGGVGVPIFFVLSGFVISMSTRTNKMDGQRLRTFFGSRFLRIIPPYWLSILAALFFAGGAAVVNGDGYQPGGSALSAGRLLSHVPLMQEIFGYQNVNDVYWTLALEVQFYVLFALILWALHRFWAPTDQRIDFVFAGSMLISAPFLLAVVDPAGRPRWFVEMWYTFALGVVIERCLNRRRSWVLPVGCSLVVLVPSFLVDSTGVAAALTALLLIALAWTNHLGFTEKSKVLSWLGRVSFSLYLIHTPVGGAAITVASKVLGTGVLGGAIATIGSVVVSLVASEIMYRIIERPATRWSKQWSKRTPTLVGPRHGLRT
jgi:peptidoglycan/LPS O-acetylase OafA/YrhL